VRERLNEILDMSDHSYDFDDEPSPLKPLKRRGLFKDKEP